MIKKIFQKYPQFKKFLIAFSGGIDSTVLLNEFFLYQKKYKNIKIRAVYINHNLSETSKIQQNYCKKFCIKKKIPFILVSIFLKNTQKYGLEASARISRYEIFKTLLKQKEILLTAHHLNDQCETFFLALKRKSGILGLSGIKFLTKFFHTYLMRPFLTFSKKKIFKIAYKNKLLWIEDKTNTDLKYERNFIRHKILPIFQKKWKYFLQNCTTSIHILSIEQKIFYKILKKKLKKYLIQNQYLSIKKFSKLSKNFQNSLLKIWLHQKIKKSPPQHLIENIQKKFLKNSNFIQKKIIFKKFLIYNKKNFLIFTCYIPNIKNIILFWKIKRKNLKLPKNLGYLKISKIKKYKFSKCPFKNTLINIKFTIENDFYILGNSKKKNIKDIWQDYNIPLEMRHKIPLIFYNKKLICGVGFFYCQNFSKKKYHHIYYSWYSLIKKKKSLKNHKKIYQIQHIKYF
ncbi:tRNA lysidine(34) synthetase TilS [Buchnera aphidicola]|uniref:tRNA lysidine(34) synthetase TilS n=1 Tax=Buchnera aphidicola TaxID=9 RepID=UPI0031B67551